MDAAPPEPQSFVEAAILQATVQEELAAILASPSFRTSKKSSEFLSYVVQVALDGRIDSLKERSIGLDLLGRDISYDPSSDATVRVRANEVRKRLNTFYSTHSPRTGYRIELLPGSYGPRFVRDSNPQNPPSVASLEPRAELRETPVPGQRLAPLPLNAVGMMRPAFIALFICALFLRQQIQSGDPYHQFWDARLQGKSAMIFAGDRAPNQTAMSDDTARALLPIIWLAGRYDLKPLMGSQKDNNDDKQAGLGGDAVIVHSAEATPPEFEADKRLRYLVSGEPGSPGSLHLVDRLGLKQDALSMVPAAVLTVFPEHPAALWIAGTDWELINKLATRISSKNDFPPQLNEETQAGHVVQAVLSGGSSPHLEIYAHQP